MDSALMSVTDRERLPEQDPRAGAAPAFAGAASGGALRRGSSGSEVERWQCRLLALGYDPGTPDGIFGAVTDAATRKLQADKGLTVDGVVGPATWAATEAQGADPPAPQPCTELAGALLARARADLGQQEEPRGSNDGPFVRGCFEGTGAQPPNNWCAAAVRRWLVQAAASLGVTPPIPGSTGAKATMCQLQQAKRWLSAAELRRDPSLVRPGMIVVWHRGDPSQWYGHIGVVDHAEGDTFATVEGNSGPTFDAVAEMRRSLGDSKLLGMGWVD